MYLIIKNIQSLVADGTSEEICIDAITVNNRSFSLSPQLRNLGTSLRRGFLFYTYLQKD